MKKGCDIVPVYHHSGAAEDVHRMRTVGKWFGDNLQVLSVKILDREHCLHPPMFIGPISDGNPSLELTCLNGV